MFRNMANSLILGEQMVTTVQKAKEVRRVVDRLITIGKREGDSVRRLAFDRTRDQLVVKKLFGELAERYKSRNGGYTRVLRMSDRRWGDAAEMAVIELVDHPVLDRKRKPKVASADAAATAETATQPMNRLKKLFGGKKKVTDSAHSKASEASEKKGAAPKQKRAAKGV